MSNRTDEIIRRQKAIIYDREWAIRRLERDRQNHVWEMNRTAPQIVAVPALFVLAGLSAVVLGIVGYVSSGEAEGYPVAIGAGAFVAILAVGYFIGGFNDRRYAPKGIVSCDNSIARYRDDIATAEAAMAKAVSRKEILARDTRWVGEKLAGLAASTGWDDADVSRLTNVIDALADDVTA